jgi:hypothetical protein
MSDGEPGRMTDPPLSVPNVWPAPGHSGSLAMLDATRLASSIVICFAVMASSSVERP